MSFELMALSRLVTDPIYVQRVLPYLEPDYFHDPAERMVFEIIKDYVYKYKVSPTKEAIAITLNDTALAEAVYDASMDIVQKFDKEDSNLDWIVDKTEGWAKDKAVYNAIMESIGIIDGKDKKHDKHAIPGILSKALGVAFNTRLGHDYFSDAERQYDYMHADDSRIPFSIDMLNRVTKGGVRPRKTMNVIMAGINTGKTTFLLQQAADWLLLAKNVLFITLEIAEEELRNRVDVCINDTTFDKLHALEKHQYVNRIRALREKTTGEFVVKEFPAGSHAGHFRHAIEELKIKRGFVPDLICIDYLTICGSSTLPPAQKGNTDTYYTAVSEEIRNLAKEYNCCVWTAAQFDRTGQAAEDVNMTNTGLSLGIQKTSDFTLAITTTEELMARDMCIGKILKSRYNNKGKIRKFMMGLDNDRQKYFDVDSSFQGETMDSDELAELNNPGVGKASSSESVSTWNFS